MRQWRYSRYYTGRMSTEETWQTLSTASEQTEQLGEQLGRALKGGEVIELASDLGGGKTTFMRGLARGAGSSNRVGSPTFTISRVYDCPHFQIHHFDFYRLPDAGIMADELAELLGDPQIVIAVEWADVVQHVLPTERLSVHIRQTPEGNRAFTFRAPPKLNYLLKAVQ